MKQLNPEEVNAIMNSNIQQLRSSKKSILYGFYVCCVLIMVGAWEIAQAEVWVWTIWAALVNVLFFIYVAWNSLQELKGVDFQIEMAEQARQQFKEEVND